MPLPILNAADCEVRAVISVLNAKNVKADDIHHEICHQFGLKKRAIKI